MGKTLKILTRHSVTIQSVYETAFLETTFAKNNDITDIVWSDPPDDQWGAIIDAGDADVIWGGGPTIFDQLIEDERLEPLTSSLMQTVAARVPDTFGGVDLKRNDTNDVLMWIAAAVSSFGFTINHHFLDTWGLEAPTNWTDIADPYYGQYLPFLPTVAMANAPWSSSNRRCYEIIVQAYGWEAGWTILARMSGNAVFAGGSSDVKAAVDNGQVGIAMSIDFYGYTSANDRPGVCEYIVPGDYTIVNGDPIAIAEKSTQKALAEGFVDYVLSAPGQALWLDEDILRLPVIESAFDEPIPAGKEDLVEALYSAYNTTKETSGIDFDDTESVGMSNSFKYYFESVFFKAQTELVDCWTAIINKYNATGTPNMTLLDYYTARMALPVSIGAYSSVNVTDAGGAFTKAYALLINDYFDFDDFAAYAKTQWTNAAKLWYAQVEAEVEALPVP